MVGREELRSRLWPSDTFVDFETGLNTAVQKLRQALDDSAEEPRYVIGVAVLSPQLVPGDRHSTTPPNRMPVVVLMDSPLPGRVYDPRAFAAGGTNADDLTDALRDLPAVIEKENTSPMWHREAQVLQQNPDLIVSHLSCLYDDRVAPGQAAVLRPLFDSAVDRLLSFFAYVAADNPRTRFLIYSRGRFEDYGGTDKFVKDAQARFPVLQGRLHPWTVPGDRGKQTFRDPNTARLIRERVKATLQTR